MDSIELKCEKLRFLCEDSLSVLNGLSEKTQRMGTTTTSLYEEVTSTLSEYTKLQDTISALEKPLSEQEQINKMLSPNYSISNHISEIIKIESLPFNQDLQNKYILSLYKYIKKLIQYKLQQVKTKPILSDFDKEQHLYIEFIQLDLASYTQIFLQRQHLAPFKRGLLTCVNVYVSARISLLSLPISTLSLFKSQVLAVCVREHTLFKYVFTTDEYFGKFLEKLFESHVAALRKCVARVEGWERLCEVIVDLKVDEDNWVIQKVIELVQEKLVWVVYENIETVDILKIYSCLSLETYAEVVSMSVRRNIEKYELVQLYELQSILIENTQVETKFNFTKFKVDKESSDIRGMIKERINKKEQECFDLWVSGSDPLDMSEIKTKNVLHRVMQYCNTLQDQGKDVKELKSKLLKVKTSH